MWIRSIYVMLFGFQEASEVSPYEIEENIESWRSAVDDALRTYVKDHYPHGVISVLLFELIDF